MRNIMVKPGKASHKVATTNQGCNSTSSSASSVKAALAASARRSSLFLKDLGQPRLRPLRARYWYISQNAEFAQLRVIVHHHGRNLLGCYAELFGTLGHNNNLVLQLDGTKLWLTRPVCTQSGQDYLVLEFLRRGVRLEPFAS